MFGTNVKRDQWAGSRRGVELFPPAPQQFFRLQVLNVAILAFFFNFPDPSCLHMELELYLAG